MAYCAASDVKAYLGVTSNTDDTLITALIAAAQGYIEAWTSQRFEASGDSDHTFDMTWVCGDTLKLDTALCSVTKVVNGDGVEVLASNYRMEPANGTPYYAIRLLPTSGTAWVSDYTVQMITVKGKWAYSATAPAAVKQACIRLASYLYRQKDNGSDLDRAVIAGNSTILPAQLPADVTAFLAPYRRIY